MENKESTNQTPDKDRNVRNNSQAMNEAGIDYIWGSDQDELVQNQEKEE